MMRPGNMSVALERTHPYGKDLDWLPPRLRALRAIRWGLTGSVLVTLMVVMFAVADAGFMGNLWWLFGGVFSGTWYGGDRIARSIVRRRLDRLARGLDGLG